MNRRSGVMARCALVLVLVLAVSCSSSDSNEADQGTTSPDVSAPTEDDRYDDDPPFSADVTYSSPVGPGPRGFLDVRGQIHQHSPHSWDACDESPKNEDGSFKAECLAEFYEGLCGAGSDFVMLTDHNDFFPEVPFPEALLYEAERGDELVMRDDRPVANRVTCDDGHRSLILAGNEGEFMPVGLEAHSEDGAAYRTLDESTAAEIEALGGVSLVSHTEGYSAEELATLPIDGFEMYNLHFNLNSALEDGSVGEVLPTVLDPDEMFHPDLLLLPILREHPIYLERWAQALAMGAQRVTTMGTDAHSNFANIAMSDGERIDSWRRLSRSFSNHLLLPARDGNEWDDADLKQALKSGRLYGAFEMLGYPQGFDFHATAGDQTVEMGDTTELAAGVTLQVGLPSVRGLDEADQPPRTVRLLRATSEGWEEVERSDSALEVTIDEPGAYRAEVRIQPEHLRDYVGSLTELAEADFAWIYSNPIYVTDE